MHIARTLSGCPKIPSGHKILPERRHTDILGRGRNREKQDTLNIRNTFQYKPFVVWKQMLLKQSALNEEATCLSVSVNSVALSSRPYCIEVRLRKLQ